MRTPSKEATPSAASVSPRPETFTPKGIPATDLKVSAKTFVLNQKPGQKMVVLPAKARTKAGSEVQLPLIHFKGIPTGMKLVPVSSQSLTHVSRSPAVTVVSKPASVVSAPAPAPRVLAAETIKTANLADIVPVKGLTPVTATKMPNPIVRPASAKGSVIVVQKGATIGKSLSFTKNSNDMTKIIMGKNVNQHLQAAKPDQVEAGKCPGNVIVLELNNDQPGRTTTMSEILDSRSGNPGRLPDESKKHQAITQDTPVLFDAPAAGERSADIGDPGLPAMDKDDDAKSLTKDSDGVKDSSSVTDWEMELDTVSRKGKDQEDKLNSLHLDLGMSSDSDGEYMAHDEKPEAKHAQATQRATPGGERSELYGSGAMSIATRTLLSQLQDEGSSSNDSSFALKSKPAEKNPAECDALTEAKEKLSEKVAEARSRHKRIDVYSTAISSADINLDAFGYLDENIMAGDDERAPPSPPSPETHSPLDKQ
ncbi:hypothetical protein MSG28_002447 [Choristoneura fumiferana]|uniref:Uncharacterized protein n=1 Tax=Choristoneura fumiferana TaxID=7141 RepID=A0ACC0JVM5_CHOFU|nr:hypothetical protein MSG28_002447 [Choristoneura fumiferana]